ncbi:MAG: UDP-N-acetyl-D-glucosamine dehydrogenase [Myxococcota bacterium]|jgi:UDP-N-acetyl-D-glucosamine dehydrogenase
MSVGIIGLGYVGIPLALRFHEVGVSVLGFDIDEARVAGLNAGISPIEHIPSERIAEMRQAGFEATAEFARVSEPEAIIICVPTPLDDHRQPDLSFILGTMKAISPHLRKGQLVSLESTTYPGTTEEEVRPFLEARGLVLGEDIFLVFSPEREDPGNPTFKTQTIPKIIGGCTPACLERGLAVYDQIIDQMVPVSTTQTAEMVKLLENIHRAVNIGLVNEMKIVADRMGIDIHEVIEAAQTKPFGFTPYYPGPGLGGHCIPVDPFYLTYKAREYGVNTRFIELAGEVNAAMPQWVIGKIGEALNDVGKPIRGSRICALGIAYKKNVDDMRESPAVKVMELLRGLGADLSYSDPHVPVFPRMRKHSFELESVELTPTVLGLYDCVVLLTDHEAFDYETIAKYASLIIDTRGKYRKPRPNIVKA